MSNYKKRKSQMAKNVKTETNETKVTPVVAKATAAPVKATADAKKETVTTIEKKEPVKAVSAPKAAPKTAEKKTAEAPKAEPKKAEPAKTETAKADAKKAAPKKTTRKTAAKKAKPEMIQEVFFEYNNEQILAESLVEQIKEAYKNEGHRVSSIKILRVYINPDERKAYYVINDKAEGKYVAF